MTNIAERGRCEDQQNSNNDAVDKGRMRERERIYDCMGYKSVMGRGRHKWR